MPRATDKPTIPRAARLIAMAPNVVRLDAFRPRAAETNTPRATCLTPKGEAARDYLLAATQTGVMREAAEPIGWCVPKDPYRAALFIASAMMHLAADMARARPDLTRDWPLPGGAA